MPEESVAAFKGPALGGGGGKDVGSFFLSVLLVALRWLALPKVPLVSLDILSPLVIKGVFGFSDKEEVPDPPPPLSKEDLDALDKKIKLNINKTSI